MRKLTQEEFLARCESVHGKAYDFTKAGYINNRTKVIVTCLTHGDFMVTPRDLLSGDGCRHCGIARRAALRSDSTEGFLESAKKVHGDKYDYSLVNYRGSRSKVKIICKVHGVFEQTPFSHKRGQGCAACGVKSRSLKRTAPFSKFKSLAVAIHGDRFEYDQSSYTSMKRSVRVKCPVHGWYSQLASDHVYKKAGCNTCADELSKSESTMPYHEFVEAANLAHGHKYTYIQSGYTSASSHMLAVCPVHGEFQQSARNHLHGPNGCPACSKSGPSAGQLVLYDYITSLGVSAELDVTIPGSRKELDVYVRSAGIAFEFDGVWWHSEKFLDKAYHAEKQALAASAGIRLIQIFSDQWRQHQEPWKQVIKHCLLPSSGVYARSCTVVQVDYTTCAEFFDTYHIQGRHPRGDGYGLVYGGKLVAVMAFSTSLSARGQYCSLARFEMVRFASSKRVVGGSSRLFSAFLRDNPGCAEVVTYSDNRVFTGSVYKAMGFLLDAALPPDYMYTIEKCDTRFDKRIMRHSSMPSTLGSGYDPSRSEHANAIANGYFRIYDSGKTRWLWKR